MGVSEYFLENVITNTSVGQTKVKIQNLMQQKSFETMEQFNHLRNTLTNQNYIREEIKSRLKSGNVYCHSVQNLFVF
jgi:hypothetical protein